MERHLAMVEPMAAAVKRKLPDSFELDDLIQSARLGLVVAAWTYRPECGPEDYWAWFQIRRELRNSYCGNSYIWATHRTELPSQLPAPLPAPSEPAEPQEQSQIKKAIRSLPAVQRLLLSLIYDQGYSVRQVGRQKLAGIGWRRTIAEHSAAIAQLRERLSA